MKKTEKILKALANISRLKIMKFLRDEELASVVRISDETGCSYKATSKHLSILFRVDLVDREQHGYEMQYQLNSGMDALAEKIIKHL